MTRLVETLYEGVVERLNDEGREAIRFAEEWSRGLGHDYVGTEHLALGVLRVELSKGARALHALDITAVRFRAQVVRITGDGGESLGGFTPGFTPRAKKVLELALRESFSLGHGYIGTEHILLAIVHENDGVASRVLLDFNADAEKVRNEVIRVLTGGRRYSPEEEKAARVAENLASLRDALARAARAASALTADGLKASGVELHVTCAQGAASCDLPPVKS